MECRIARKIPRSRPGATIQRVISKWSSAEWKFGFPVWVSIKVTSLALADAEGQQLLILARVFQRVAGLIDQIRNIDTGEWIGAFDDKNVAGLHAGKRLAGAQRGQRAFEAAQIEGFFGHFVPVVEAAKPIYHTGDDRR